MPVVWQLSVAHFAYCTILHGVLTQTVPYKISSKSGWVKNISDVLRSYLVHPVANKEIQIVSKRNKVNAKTDAHGGFYVTNKFSSDDKIEIFFHKNSKPLEVVQQYPVSFQEAKGEYVVISDIDDTIMVSNSTDFFKRLATVGLLNPAKRKVVGYTFDLLKELNVRKSRFFYVSKSEANLYGIITEFIRHHGLPEGSIMLTPYLNLFHSSVIKKSNEFKEERISTIIENSDRRIILVGDDSQLDMDTYTNIASSYIDRISHIFIRQTKKHRSGIQAEKWERLQSVGVRSTYFDSKDQFDKNILFS